MKLFYIITFLFSVGFSTAFSQWTSNPALGKAVRTGPNIEKDNYSVHDGRGGAFIFWQSFSPQTGSTLLAYTRLTSEGLHAFGSPTSGRILISGSDYVPYLDEAIPDGNDGVFVTYKMGGLYLQHVDASGIRLMGSSGKLISENEDTKCHLALDGNGGVFATWEEWVDDESDFTYTIAQRFSSTGTAQWAPTNSGIRVVTNNAIADTYNYGLGIVESGAGEVVIAFQDNRNSNYDEDSREFDNLDIYAQKLDIDGNRLWGAGGKQVCTNNKNQYSYGEKGKNLLTTDKAAGAIIAWEDYRNDPYNGDDGDGGDIFAQRLNSDGVAMWGAEGVAVCTADDFQDDITMMPSANGGAIIIWNDVRSRPTNRIFTQVIRPDGTPLLPLNGKAVFANYQSYVAHPSADNLYFLLAIENDEREVIVQKIEAATGNFLWGTGQLMANLSFFETPISIVHDGLNGAIVSYDFNDDIYANRVGGNGLLPVNLIKFEAVYTNGNAELNWTTAQEQNSNYFSVERSLDGQQFVAVGRLSAAGNSQTEKTYKFTDPVSKAGIADGSIVFYRLNMVDKDGKKEYSPVRKITIPITETIVKIAGNPVKDQLKLLLTAPKQQQGQLQVYNLEGRLMYQQNVRLHEGENQLNITANTWPNGGYIINFSSSKQTKSIPFIKN